MLSRALLVLLALALLAGDAAARMKAGPTVMSAHVRVRNLAPPLTALTAPAAGYGFRLLRQAYLGTGAAVRVRRASDNQESDIGFAGSGDFDLNTATAFCSATSCFVRTWYDQSGNGLHVQQATAANQPALVFNCTAAGKPCVRSTSGTQRLDSASMTPNAVLTFNTVGRIAVRSGNCFWITIGNNWLLPHASADLATLFNTAQINVTSTTLFFHAITGSFNGAAAVISSDTTEAFNAVSAATVAAPLSLAVGAAATSCDQAEALVWNAYALTAAERQTLNANQKAYWGF